MRSRLTILAVLGAALAVAAVPCALATTSCGAAIYIPATRPNTDAGVADDALCAAACPILDQADCGVPSCVAVCIADQTQGAASQLSPQCVLSAGPDPHALQACGACR